MPGSAELAAAPPGPDTVPGGPTAPTDSCPSCQAPPASSGTGGTLIAHYRCGCGHVWWTGWALSALHGEAGAA